MELSTDYFHYLCSIKPHVYDKYLKLFCININNPYLTFYQKFLLNFLCLLNEENKVIIFEKPKIGFDLNDKIIKDIFRKIKQKNSVFILEINDH
ncbi:hypothetical protein II654_00110 [bacterium]|nr:hypothetical protein [bacterium]